MMMVDLNASLGDLLGQVDWDSVGARVQEKVADYAPVIEIARKTWSRETFREIGEGKVFVPDEMINDWIADGISEGSQIRSLSIASREDGRLGILAETEKLGRIECSGTIEEFVHDGKTTRASYRVRERALLDHGLGSWVFSRLSLSMTQRIMGGLKFSEETPTKIRHNTVTVDLSKQLEASDLARVEFRGYRLLDIVRIEGAKPKAGGIEIDTGLSVPEELKAALLRILE